MHNTEERVLKVIKKRFGYNEEDLEKFKNDPRNLELIGRAKEFNSKLFIIEVVGVSPYSWLQKLSCIGEK